MTTALVAGFIEAFGQSFRELREHVSEVKYGPNGILRFTFKGKKFEAPEPIDVMPVGDSVGSKTWALRQVLDGNAKEVDVWTE